MWHIGKPSKLCSKKSVLAVMSSQSLHGHRLLRCQICPVGYKHLGVPCTSRPLPPAGARGGFYACSSYCGGITAAPPPISAGGAAGLSCSMGPRQTQRGRARNAVKHMPHDNQWLSHIQRTPYFIAVDPVPDLRCPHSQRLRMIAECTRLVRGQSDQTQYCVSELVGTYPGTHEGQLN